MYVSLMLTLNVFSLLYYELLLLHVEHNKKKKFFIKWVLTKCSTAMRDTHTDLGEVINKSEMSFLQLSPRQRRQRVGIVQLFAVVRREQVRVQPNHMGGICRAQEGKFVKFDFMYHP